MGRHELCTRKGKTVYDEGHRKPRNTGAGKLAERILIYVSGNREVALWMENLKRRKERYYKDNLEVILRIIPGFDKSTLIEAVRICLDKGIYNGESVRSLCEHVCGSRGQDKGTAYPDGYPGAQSGAMRSYNEIFAGHDKA